MADTDRDAPGMDAAVEAVAKHLDCYDTVMHVRAESQGAVQAAYPVIAAAVRAEVLAEVEAVLVRDVSGWCDEWEICLHDGCAASRCNIADLRALGEVTG